MNGCRWVQPGPEFETRSIAENLGFESPRIFWLTGLAEGLWRGRHAHRESVLATFAVVGACRIMLDDGKQKQSIELRANGPGLIIGPWIWHELHDFTSDATILVIASTRYDEAEYIRDYDLFLREAAKR